MLLDRPPRGRASAARGFVLYVEGARDRDLLQVWGQRVSPPLGRVLGRSAVILGGRQPARALDHFRALRTRGAVARGLCVLDRDGEDRAEGWQGFEPGLEFFTWGRRHIESYLLVPAAIRRGLGFPNDDARLARFLRTRVPACDDEAAFREVDAKRLLGPNGPLARVLGHSVALSRIARAMRREELHPDVRGLLARVRQGLGLGEPEVRVSRRDGRSDPGSDILDGP